jgi:hypothetical protein
MDAVDLDRAQEAQGRLTEALAGKPAVSGIGLSRVDGGYVLKVNVRATRARKDIPVEIDGVPVRVSIVGRVRKRRPA